MTLLPKPSIQLHNSLTVLKITFYENAQEYLLSSKIDKLFCTFISDQLDHLLALRNNSHEVGVRTERPLRKPMLCGAHQTRPKKSACKQKSASEQKKRKIENPRRAQSFNEPSCFARTHSHDVGTRTKNRSGNRSSAVQSKPDRKKARASQASEQRSGKNSPGRRRQQRREEKAKQTSSEKTLC